MRSQTLYFKLIGEVKIFGISRVGIIKDYEFRYDSHVIGQPMANVFETDMFYESTIGRKLQFKEIELDEHLLDYYDSNLCNSRRVFTG